MNEILLTSRNLKIKKTRFWKNFKDFKISILLLLLLFLLQYSLALEIIHSLYLIAIFNINLNKQYPYLVLFKSRKVDTLKIVTLNIKIIHN